MRFFITGLPRSRTAWLARLFCYGESYCFHDALLKPDWQVMMDMMPQDAVGVSDSGLTLLRDFPEGRYLLVRRDPADSLRSFLAMDPYPVIGKPDPKNAALVYSHMMLGMDRIENEMDTMVVKYADLDDEDTLRLAWSFLVGAAQPWCAEHYEEMRHLRVLVRPETYKVN